MSATETSGVSSPRRPWAFEEVSIGSRGRPGLSRFASAPEYSAGEGAESETPGA